MTTAPARGLFYARKKPRLSTRDTGVFTQQSKCRESKERVIVFVFSFNTEFLILSVCCLAGPAAGRKSNCGKIKAVKTQSQDLALSIVNTRIHIFFKFFCPHVVNSKYCCMFEVLQ